jgi:homoserine dehydrogenase
MAIVNRKMIQTGCIILNPPSVKLYASAVLTQMEIRGIEFEAALDEAQKAGDAEADPTLDIDGLNARDKLCILARMAFGGCLKVSMIPTYGILQVRAIDVHSANRLDCTIRLVGSAENTESGIEISVRPWMVSRRSMLAKVEGMNNAIFLVGDEIGTQMFYRRRRHRSCCSF